MTVVAPPRALPAVPRSWGWMLQLYALHSPASWGLGDLGDLRTFVNWTGPEHGASAVLLNPLHAITPVPPVQPSPYTPSSRRFGTPLALRVTDVDAYAQADPATRAEVDALRPEPVGGRIDYDRSWAAKRSATELLWRAAGRPAPPTTAPDLELFATFCALAERHRRSVEPLARGAAAPVVAGGGARGRRARPPRRLPRLAAGRGAAAAR